MIDAIAMPNSGSPEIAKADVRAVSSAASSTGTARRTPTGAAAGLFRDSEGRCVVAKRGLMIDVLLPWVARLAARNVTRKPELSREVSAIRH
jgi:hypothetical protein